MVAIFDSCLNLIALTKFPIKFFLMLWHALEGKQNPLEL
jgi:hypothetical protein